MATLVGNFPPPPLPPRPPRPPPPPPYVPPRPERPTADRPPRDVDVAELRRRQAACTSSLADALSAMRESTRKDLPKDFYKEKDTAYARATCDVNSPPIGH